MVISMMVWILICTSGCDTNSTWQSRFESALPEYGHRNWIVIADAAYPMQSAPGIETIATGDDHFEVLNHVLEAIDGDTHVRAIVMLDAELEHVSPDDAPGVTDYRTRLRESLGDMKSKVMPHEEIISRLDEDSRMFNVLLLKTNLTIPYTSVFIQLDAGYWDADKEKRLRDSFESMQK
jgi:L-fucose mutarotase/ribose pyranase (RbsD/FucU family)